jgi:glutaconate CoA-transferase subunit A
MSGGKLLSLAEAARLVPEEGCTLGLGGVTLYRRPMAFALALRRRFLRDQAPRDLTLLAFTAGLESDLLIGAGLVRRMRSCYVGLEVFGLAPHFTASASAGRIEIVEETEASLAFGIRARLAGVGFMPSHAWQGTELPRLRPDVRTVVDPYSGEELTAFPAIECDIAVIHALEADPDGNAAIGGNRGVDSELALVAKHVIVTAESIVPRLAHADIFGPVVRAVVEAPGGAWPTSCHPLYPLDGMAILRYSDTAGTQDEEPMLSEWSQRHGIP